MKAVELIKLFGSVASSILGVVAVLTLIIKPLKAKFLETISKVSGRADTEEQINDIREQIARTIDLLQNHVALDEKKRCTDEAQTNALKSILRNNITMIYYKYKDEECIPQYDKELVLDLYKSYHEMGGNSWIGLLMKEIETFSVKKGV